MSIITGLYPILPEEEEEPKPEEEEPRQKAIWSDRKNPKGLRLKINMTPFEVQNNYENAIQSVRRANTRKKWDYYKTYVRHILPDHDDLPYDQIFPKLHSIRGSVQELLDTPKHKEVLFVNRILQENRYVSKQTKRPGLIVKMFHTYYDGRDVFVKTFLYDPECESFRRSIMENFINEVVFQTYADQLRSYIRFISPEVYSCGKIRKFVFEPDGYIYQCLFLIMEYIPFVTLKEAVCSTENMTRIYERVEQIDKELCGQLLHHNDLHAGNILVDDTSWSDNKLPLSPYPEVVLIDFGEASLGPKKPMFTYGVRE